MLFDSADRFEDFSAPARIETMVADGRTALTLPAMPVGDYALVVFHDENGNGFQRNRSGSPTNTVPRAPPVLRVPCCLATEGLVNPWTSR